MLHRSHNATARARGKEMKKKSIRVGQKVSSIYDPERIFLLDRSVKAEPMFREKGTKNWYRQSELLAICRAKKGRKGWSGSQLQKRPAHLRSLAFPSIPVALSPKEKPVYHRECLDCGVKFNTEHEKQKFCVDAHRTRFWKRRKELPKVPARLRSERVA